MSHLNRLSTDIANPTPVLGALGTFSRGYSKLFAASRIAPVISRRRPVRRTGFDLDLIVTAVTPEAEDVVSLTLVRPDGAELPAWIPGAHLDVFTPSGRQRHYSLNGNPNDHSHYRIAIRRMVGGGGGSIEMVDTVRSGDALHVRGPRNAFTFINAPAYLFIAAGIGVTPILPMVKAAEARGATWKFIYLGRSRASMPFLTEIEALGGDVEIRPDDEFGIPDAAELLGRAEPGAAVYVCGPTALLDAARTLMAGINPTGSLHVERFSPPSIIGGHAFEVTLDKTGRTITVDADESVLSAVRRELPYTPYSCQQGFCGTCKVGVLVGAVDHHDRVLIDSERHDSMMICVSRASGDSLVLDL